MDIDELKRRAGIQEAEQEALDTDKVLSGLRLASDYLKNGRQNQAQYYLDAVRRYIVNARRNTPVKNDQLEW